MIPSAKPQTENEPKQAWMIALIAVATAATVYAVTQQKEMQKEAAKETKKMRAEEMAKAEQLQLQAGEYWEELTMKQMALQQSENRFKTLADLLLQKVKKTKEQSQEILMTPVTPAAAELSLVEKINQSIDKFLKG
jgi:uncharacterized membrane protein YheB (UPF0754 family)